MDITVKRNKETVMDLSKIHIEEVAIGHVEFKLSPEYAQLYIDGELTEYEDRVPVEFGVHSIKVEAAGYESVSTNIKVSSEYVNIEIALDPDPNATSTPTPTANPSGAGSGSTVASVSSDSPTAPPVVDLGGTYGFPTAPPANTGTSSTGSTSSSGSTSTSSTDTSGSTSASSTDTSSSSTDSSSDSSSTETVITATKKLYVEQPAGAEVYLDGVYIGIAPTSTPKVTGSHVITLSRSGFVTKSYTVNIDDDGNDITLSFGSLSPEEDE